MKKLHYFLFILLLCSQGALAQDLIGKVTDQDSAHTPLYMAAVDQMQNGKIIATCRTYFDGTFHIKVTPGQTYQLRASYPGRTDTTVSISIDKHGALYTGTVFISLRKDGMRLTGYILDGAQDLPIRDASIILRNVMTRKEERYTTGTDGSYNLKMDYETNYTFKIDKMSPGIINKYQDTSFNISTIGFNKPLDFRLDIRLAPATGSISPRREYDPHAKPDNRNLKPALVVLGTKDSLQKHKQDSIVAVLSKKVNTKDSLIASLDKRIDEIRKADSLKRQQALTTQREQLSATKEKAKEDSLLAIAIQKNREIIARRKHIKDSLSLIEDQKTEAKVDVPKISNRGRLQVTDNVNAIPKDTPKPQIKTDIINVVEAARINDSLRIAKALLAERRKRIMADSLRSGQDSLLVIALAKNKEILERRKYVADSLALIESKKLQAINDAKKQDMERQDRELAEKQLREKHEREAIERNKAEIAEKEKKAKEEQALAAAKKTEQDAAMKRAQIAEEQKQAKEEAERKAKAIAEQRELETKKAQEQQEKEQLKQLLNKVQQEQASRTDDQESKQSVFDPESAPSSPPLHPVSRQVSQVMAAGVVKSGKTIDPLPGVSVNIRRLNSVVSQEVTSDQNGRYQIMLDSGYFYLIAYYSPRYEISKQLVDLNTYKKQEYIVPTQYLKDVGDFDPNAPRMQVIQFEKNNAKLSASAWDDLAAVLKMLDQDPGLRIKIFGLASANEDQPVELSVDRARSAADILMSNGVRSSKISISGIGASRTRSGCTIDKQCTEESYQLDRVVMYKIVKE